MTGHDSALDNMIRGGVVGALRILAGEELLASEPLPLVQLEIEEAIFEERRRVMDLGHEPERRQYLRKPPWCVSCRASLHDRCRMDGCECPARRCVRKRETVNA